MRNKGLRTLLFLSVLMIGLSVCGNSALGQPAQPLSPSEIGVGIWLDYGDTGVVLRALEENPILKEQVEWYKRQHDLDEREKAILNERLGLEKERVKIEQERTKVAEERELAMKQALEVQKSITEDYKTLMKQQEKEVKKAKTTGFLVGAVGAIVAIFALIVAF